MDWLSDAACRDVDPELFFPVGLTGPAASQIRRAKTVCRRCPVVRQCGEWALAHRDITGVWGGMNDDERRAERSARRRAAAMTTR